jgi:hypothetical protein
MCCKSQSYLSFCSLPWLGGDLVENKDLTDYKTLLPYFTLYNKVIRFNSSSFRFLLRLKTNQNV